MIHSIKSSNTELKINQDEFIAYRVKSGDTVSKLSKYFQVPVKDLLADNQIENADLIYIGQDLRIRQASVLPAQSNLTSAKIAKEFHVNATLLGEVNDEHLATDIFIPRSPIKDCLDLFFTYSPRTIAKPHQSTYHTNGAFEVCDMLLSDLAPMYSTIELRKGVLHLTNGFGDDAISVQVYVSKDQVEYIERGYWGLNLLAQLNNISESLEHVDRQQVENVLILQSPIDADYEDNIRFTLSSGEFYSYSNNKPAGQIAFDLSTQYLDNQSPITLTLNNSTEDGTTCNGV